MRTTDITLSSGQVITVTYPNLRAITNTPYSFVKLYYEGNLEVDVSLTVGNATVRRKFKREGLLSWVLFPISDLMEYTLGDKFYSSMDIEVVINGESFDIGSMYAFSGVSQFEIKDLGTSTEGIPEYDPITIYPNAPDGIKASQILLRSSFPSKTVSANWNSSTAAIFSSSSPVLSIPSGATDKALEPYPDITTESSIVVKLSTASHEIPVYIDPCNSGVFTQWINTEGLVRTFRWDVEKIIDDYSDEATASSVLVDYNSEYIDFNNRDKKSRRRSLLLHSGMLSRNISDVARSILSGRDIQYYDENVGRWMRCRVANNTLEDDLSPMTNITIELVTIEESLPW